MQFKTPRYGETWLGLIMGTATGAITVATGIFVIPGTPYIQSLQFERDKLVQALGLSFTVSTITLAAALAHAGQIRAALAGPSVVALGAALVGMIFGQLMRGRVRAETFRLWFFIGLLVLGAHLALRGLPSCLPHPRRGPDDGRAPSAAWARRDGRGRPAAA